MPRRESEKESGGGTMSLKIVLGDITEAETTAIVNAANTSLLGGGGVDGAIHRAAGPKLLAECRGLHGCRTGQAKITKGYNLKAEYIIHTPGPRYLDGRHNEAGLLESCYRSCLELAVQYKIRDISFPSISTGIYRFPLQEAAAVAVRTIHDYSRLEVTMVCFDEETKLAYDNALALYLRDRPAEEVCVEYVNLPMSTAFQNEELAAQAGNLVGGTAIDFDTWLNTRSTFRQMGCLGRAEDMPADMYEAILNLMEAQDLKAPYPLTRLYPYLLDDSWELDM